MTERTSVYVLTDADGRALYVGISNRPARRLWQHSRTAPWFDAVRTITLSHHASKADARAEEQRLIAATRPIHNVRHNPTHQMLPASLTFTVDQYNQLLKAAQAEGRTFANLIRHIAALWLERREPKTEEEEEAA